MINKIIPLCLLMLLCGTLAFASQATQNDKDNNKGEVHSDDTPVAPAKKAKVSIGALSIGTFLLAPTLTTSRLSQQHSSVTKKPAVKCD